jgi:aminoglycoside phosphotransferase (APT) family kinase protein
MDRVRALPHQLPATTLCHFDIRDDNLLVREDGQAVVVDWGMARLGPAWTDLVLLAAQKPHCRAGSALDRTVG